MVVSANHTHSAFLDDMVFVHKQAWGGLTYNMQHILTNEQFLYL